MAILQSCCCWRSVRKGSFACAIYTGIYFALMATVMGNYLQEEVMFLSRNETDLPPTHKSFLETETITPVTLVFSIVFLSCSVCGVLASLLLVYGLYSNRRELLIPWVANVLVFTLVDIAHCLYIFIVLTLRINPHNAILFTMDFFLLTLNVYSLLCVISQYQEYKDGRGRASDDNDHRLPSVQYSVPATGTSYVSTRRAVTCNETRPTPTQSPTGPPPPVPPSDELICKPPRKHVQFPDTPPAQNGNHLEVWSIDVRSAKLLGREPDTAPLIHPSKNSNHILQLTEPD